MQKKSCSSKKFESLRLFDNYYENLGGFHNFESQLDIAAIK